MPTTRRPEKGRPAPEGGLSDGGDGGSGILRGGAVPRSGVRAVVLPWGRRGRSGMGRARRGLARLDPREALLAGGGGMSRAMTELLKDILKEPGELRKSLAYTLGPGRTALERAARLLNEAETVYLTGIGSSWHAGMAVQSLLQAGGR